MKLSRDITLIFHYIFDQLMPPVIRDSRWFMWIPFKILFKDKSSIFFTFKERAPFMSEKEFRNVYINTASVHIQRETDINQECLKAIEEYLVGETILDIACGRGFLTKLLAPEYKLTGADIVIDKSLINSMPNVSFKETSLESLPFKDKEFDTVICAHTLEHVQDVQSAINELKRVTNYRLIIVLPKQRSYKYTFDLHLHFFSYEHDVLKLLKPSKDTYKCLTLGGDWFYVEDLSHQAS